MIIMRTFFEGIPEELEDAAKIDGCSEWKTLLKIVLPVSKPALASIGLFLCCMALEFIF
ncbi:MAG: ABC transporter permease subunit [Blautia sp.]